MSMEELTGRAFQRAARLTPEQMGMLKLYLAIMRELDEAEEREEPLKVMGPRNDGIDSLVSAAGFIQSLNLTGNDKTAEPENEMPAPANEKPQETNEKPEPDNMGEAPEPEPTPRRSGNKEPEKEVAPEVARFAEYLISHDISQRRAAADLGIKAGSISNIITGKYKASPRTCAAMKEYVDVREAHGPKGITANPPRAAVRN